MNQHKNMYLEARKTASKYDERLSNREIASGLIGVSPYTLSDYERGNVKFIPPDKIRIMAEVYKAPELINHYCKNECPLGSEKAIETEIGSIERAALRIIYKLSPKEISDLRQQILEITEDGRITDSELDSLERVIGELERLEIAISGMKAVSKKILMIARGKKKVR